ncbi:unnamed protein product [Brassica oleracea var. botrytis]|uniref:Uncharacterized protein n=1 Tax=Brassica oleracea TaxID=3712 RepID=A0A3P6DLV9_BRAOL|nr:unnamed protein product [Brassica oleracea]
MSNGEYDTTFDLSEIWDRLQRPDRNDNGPTSLAKLLNRAGSHSNSSVVFSDFKIRYFQKTQNEIADSLAEKTFVGNNENGQLRDNDGHCELAPLAYVRLHS